MTTATTTPAKPAGPTVDEFIDPARIPADVTLDLVNLSDAISRQPALTYYYATLVAKAERQVSTLKLQLEAKEAQAYSQIKEKALADGEKITEGGVASKVRQVPEILRLDQAIIRAQEVAACLRGASFALRDKAEMIKVSVQQQRMELQAKIDFDRSLETQGPIANNYGGQSIREKAAAARAANEQ